MPDVDLDRVEAGVAQHARAVRVLLDDRRDRGRRRRVSAPHAERAEHTRRRERGRLRSHRVRNRARVTDLRGDGGALGVDRVGEFP